MESNGRAALIIISKARKAGWLAGLFIIILPSGAHHHSPLHASWVG
jgi:hypothetical protein